jgi:hypothetical protein
VLSPTGIFLFYLVVLKKQVVKIQVRGWFSPYQNMTNPTDLHSFRVQTPSFLISNSNGDIPLEVRWCAGIFLIPKKSNMYQHLKCTAIPISIQNVEKYYSRVQNKHSPKPNNFLTFFQGLRPYFRLHRAYFSSIFIRYKWGQAYSFCQIIPGLPLFKGLRLFQTLE